MDQPHETILRGLLAALMLCKMDTASHMKASVQLMHPLATPQDPYHTPTSASLHYRDAKVCRTNQMFPRAPFVQALRQPYGAQQLALAL